MNDENKIKDVIDAATGLVKAVPIYPDAIQPGAKQLGLALETIGKAINVALAPISGLVWGYEKVRDFVHSRVAEKLKSTPPEDIQPPKPNIAGPAIEALRYTGHEPMLSELYANLLAASIDKKTATSAHPAFVEIIKQLSPDEALLMALFNRERAFPSITLRRQAKEGGGGGNDVVVHFSYLGQDARCKHPELTPAYLDNLRRLGLIEIPAFGTYTNAEVYKPLEDDLQIKILRAQIDSVPNQESSITRHVTNVTQLGRQFIAACVIDHEQMRNKKTAEAGV